MPRIYSRRRYGSGVNDLDHALSDSEISALLPGIHIISYPDLEGFSRIEDAFDGEGRVVILFLTESNTVGHWICVHAMPDGGIECFDAYGLLPDGPMRWLSKSKRVVLHEDVPTLSRLLAEAQARNIKVHYSPYNFQSDKHGVATCGRHVVVRLMKRDLSLPAYAKFIRAGGRSPDRVVTDITNNALRHHNA